MIREGKEVQMICQICGANNPEGSLYCLRCLNRIEEPALENPVNHQKEDSSSEIEENDTDLNNLIESSKLVNRLLLDPVEGKGYQEESREIYTTLEAEPDSFQTSPDTELWPDHEPGKWPDPPPPPPRELEWYEIEALRQKEKGIDS